jgi:hypothetical protein
MSVVLKLPEKGTTKQVYLIYDFKQVSDSILLIMYVNELKRWKKFFIDYEDGAWKTDSLAPYTDNETLQRICDKLKFIFLEQTQISKPADLNLEETMQQEAAFMLGISGE